VKSPYKWLLLIAILLFTLTLSAQETQSTPGLIFTFSTDGGDHYIVSSYTGTDTDIIIPSSHTESEITAPVTEIGEFAFYSKWAITTVTLPNTITAIRQNAFDGCINMTDITLSTSLTTIEQMAFSTCVALTEINLPQSLITLGIYAFLNCNGLTSFHLPQNVYDIGPSASNGSYTTPVNPILDCPNITSITVDPANTRYKAVDNCLIKTLEKILVAGCQTSIIPIDANIVQSIAAEAFMYQKHLTYVFIANNITAIGANAFTYIETGLRIYVTHATRPPNFAINAFDGITVHWNILSIQPWLPHTTVSNGAIVYRWTMPSEIFPDIISSQIITHWEIYRGEGAEAHTNQELIATKENREIFIDDYDLYWKYIDEDIALSTLYCYNVKPIYKGGYDGTMSANSIISYNGSLNLAYIYADELDGYFVAKGSCADSVIVIANEYNDGTNGLKPVLAIAENGFANLTDLVKISLPDSLLNIGKYAFWKCHNLQEITLPNNVRMIE
jgi:hypothetical protein